ncbi:MAG TPA: hypothetical protein VFA12_09015 [Stellaceae bacterium]|nr:hypothetical protein [Stellaceae bacterium]
MLLHVAWRNNLDSYDVALAVNRLTTRGAAVWWLGGGGPRHEPGDYLCDVSDGAAASLAGFGVTARPWNAPLPDRAIPLAYPRIALFAGKAAPWPAFAYGAIALARLGFACELVDGATVAAGGLQRCDLVFLADARAPGGLDLAEGVAGADAKFYSFLADRGAAVATGAGGFLLSSGRSRRTGTVRALPRQGPCGAGVVEVQFGADSIGFGCPPTLELPYYRGPVYDQVDRGVSVAARFHRLAVACETDPLAEAQFERELAGRPAVLRAEGRRGRAVVFSTVPEMGDLIRRHDPPNEPLSGESVLDPPSFRPLLNAIHSLMLRTRPPSPALAADEPPPVAAAPAPLPAEAFVQLDVPDDNPRFAAIAADLRSRFGRAAVRFADAQAALSRLDGAASRIQLLWAQLARAAAACRPADDEPPAGRLADADTRLLLIESWCALAEADARFAVRPP